VKCAGILCITHIRHASRQSIRCADGAERGRSVEKQGDVPGGNKTHRLCPCTRAFQAEVAKGSMCSPDPLLAGPMTNHLLRAVWCDFLQPSQVKAQVHNCSFSRQGDSITALMAVSWNCPSHTSTPWSSRVRRNVPGKV